MSGRPQATLIRTGLLSALASASDMIPVLFCDQGSSDFSKQGDELAKLIESSTGHKCLSLPFIGIWETVALISQLSALVTTKLHVGIVAYALGVYCESFATHRKTPRFYRQIGRSSQSLMWNDIDQTIAREKTERALQMACSKASIIDENWHRIKKESLINHKLVYDFIDLVLK